MDTSLEAIQKAMQESGVGLRENIEGLEEAMLKKEQVEYDLYHHFFPGIYIREVLIPKGALVLGHYHKTECLNIFLKGKATLVDDNGSTSTIEAPMMFMSKPGRKLAYAIEDMTWQNIFLTDETNIEKLEEMYFDMSDNFLSSRERGELCQQ